MAVYDPCATYTSLQTALRNSKPMARYSVLPPSFPPHPHPPPPHPPPPPPSTNQPLPPCTLQSLPLTNTNSNVFDWRCPVKTGGTIAWTNCIRQSITRLDACKISSVRMAIGSQKYSDKDSDDEQSNLSAFLGPNLWEKSYGTDFKLEYMDLDEFLVENGIPTDPMADEPDADSASTLEVKSSLINSAPTSPTSEDIFSDNDSSMSGKASMDATSELQDDTEKIFLPGEKGFDPAKRKFTKEELKPQPLIKKSRKVFVPDNHKDDKYWARRKKNNVAAKRSRDARRVKENQIALRANFLENENNGLKVKLEKALNELTIVKTEKESLASQNLYLQKQLKKFTR